MPHTWKGPYGRITLYCADCLDVLPTPEECSVDCAVTDPPYGHNNNNDDLIYRREAVLGELRKGKGMRRKWNKLPPWTGRIHQGCLNCPPVAETAPMDTIVAVGFGYAAITRDGEVVYSEPLNATGLRFRRLCSFEKKAARDPHHDWRLIFHAPLRSRTYQRHGDKLWVLVDSNQGFA